MIGAYFVAAIGLFYLFVVKVKGKAFLERWGMVRFSIVAALIAMMFSLPAKMALRLLFNVKYVLVTPWINI
jgi:hypothetical protein